MKNYTLYHHIVFSSPKDKINDILKENGFKPAKSPDEAVEKLKSIVRKGGEDALEQMAMIHPDRDLLLKSFTNEYNEAGDCPVCADGMTVVMQKEEEEEEKFDNACACKGGQSAAGDEEKEGKENKKPKSGFIMDLVKVTAVPIIFAVTLITIVSMMCKTK